VILFTAKTTTTFDTFYRKYSQHLRSKVNENAKLVRRTDEITTKMLTNFSGNINNRGNGQLETVREQCDDWYSGRLRVG